MARKKIFDGNGATLKHGSTVIGGIVRFTALPGWEKTEIDDTELGNTDVTTFVLGNLKTYGECGFDLKFGNSGEVPEGNQEWTITLKDGSTLVFWGQLRQLGDATVENNAGITRSCSIKLTNLNGAGVETKPVLTISGGDPGSASASASTPASTSA